MTKHTRRKFKLVFCDRCDRRLAEVLLDTEVYCPTCSTWTVAVEPERRAS